MCLTAAFVFGQSVPMPFDGDVRLKPSITLNDKIVPLSTIAIQLERATQVHFTVDKSIRDRKVTVFVQDKPVSEVMWAVQSALFLQFENSGDTYRLVLPDRIWHEEEEIIADEDDAVKNAISAELRRLAGLCTKSIHAMAQEVSELQEKMKPLVSKHDHDSVDEVSRCQSRLNELEDYRVAGVALAMGPDFDAVTQRLVAGQSLAASSESVYGLPQLDPRMVPDLRDGGLSLVFSSACAIMKYDALSHKLVIHVRTVGQDDSNGVSMFDAIDLSPQIESGTARSKLRKRTNAWSQLLDTKVAFAKLPPKTPAPPASEYYGRAYSLADHLEYLSKAAQVPIVADAFRIAVSDERYMSGPDLITYIGNLRSIPKFGNALASPGPIRTENGWLMVRHNHPWSRQLTEVPESVMQGLESEMNGDSTPSVDEYADFVAKLSPIQALAFSKNNAILMRCPTNPLHNILALNLWAHLTRAERDLAKSDSLTMGALDADKRPLLFQCCLEILMDSLANENNVKAVFSMDTGLRMSIEEVAAKPGAITNNLERIRENSFGPNPGVVSVGQTIRFWFKHPNGILGYMTCQLLKR